MTEQVPLTTSPLAYRLTVEDFFRLDEGGAFEGFGKTELIRGEVFYMNAQHRPHARMKGQLHLDLVQALANLNTGLAVLIEATVAMPPHSAPEPDLILTSEPDGEGPVPIASVRLLVEIADTTQKNDLRVKAGLYAENGVAEYWVVDLRPGSPTGCLARLRGAMRTTTRLLWAAGSNRRQLPVSRLICRSRIRR